MKRGVNPIGSCLCTDETVRTLPRPRGSTQFETSVWRGLIPCTIAGGFGSLDWLPTPGTIIRKTRFFYHRAYSYACLSQKQTDCVPTDQIEETIHFDPCDPPCRRFKRSFATILAEARKYRLNLVIAHQFMQQLPDLLRQAVIGNVGSILAFRIGAEDAEILHRELGTDAQALLDTPDYHAWLRRSDALLIRTLPPEMPCGTFQAVLNRTRACHARRRRVD
jgi:hypothetical protein